MKKDVPLGSKLRGSHTTKYNNEILVEFVDNIKLSLLSDGLRSRKASGFLLVPCTAAGSGY